VGLSVQAGMRQNCGGLVFKSGWTGHVFSQRFWGIA
jgi:hypothetical protein